MNHLIQLQELLLIREVQKVHGETEHLDTIDDSVNTMTKQLPSDLRALFLKLKNKDRNIVVPIADGNCSVCGMRLPISLIQAVRLGREIQCCPNCARILYDASSSPRHIGRKPRRSEPKKLGIARFSSPELMIPLLQATDKEGAIAELASKMEDAGFVDSGEKLTEEALRRESIISTAVDHGLAFPHVRGVEGGGLTLALGLSSKGIRFDGPEQQLTKIVFFMVIPTAASAFYLKILAGLTETFMKTDARKKILAEKDPAKLWKALVKVTRANVK